MKGLIHLILKQFQLLILLNTGATVYGLYNTHIELVKEIQSRKDSFVQKIKTQIDKNKAIKEFEKNLELSKERIKEVATQIEKVQKQLPNSIQDTEILDFFSKESNGLNIKDIFLAPMKEENRDFYFGKQYQFKGSGTFLQFMIFFERIGADDNRLLNVRALSMNKKKGKQKGRFQMLEMVAIMEAFRYNPDYKGDSFIKSTEENKEEGSPINKLKDIIKK